MQADSTRMTTILTDHASHRVVGPGEQILTVPNVVTVVRTFGAILFAIWGVLAGLPLLLGIGYAIYWLGDVLDGWLARRLDQETRVGAVLDIVSDRACTCALVIGLLGYMPEAAPAVFVFLMSFMVLDAMLSMAFLYWGLTSPNYFYEVDRTVWLLNWSRCAKAANTGAFAIALALGSVLGALLLVTAILAIKVWSAVRIAQLLQKSL